MIHSGRMKLDKYERLHTRTHGRTEHNQCWQYSHSPFSLALLLRLPSPISLPPALLLRLLFILRLSLLLRFLHQPGEFSQPAGETSSSHNLIGAVGCSTPGGGKLESFCGAKRKAKIQEPNPSLNPPSTVRATPLQAPCSSTSFLGTNLPQVLANPGGDSFHCHCPRTQPWSHQRPHSTGALQV